MRLLLITFPLWFPFYLLWEDEDLELVAASILWAPLMFVVGVVLHGGWAIVNLVNRERT